MGASIVLIGNNNSGLNIPKEILLDTSFLTILGTPSHIYFSKAFSFLNECIKNGIELYYTPIVVNELTHHYEKVYAKEEATKLGLNIADPKYNGAYGHKEIIKDIYAVNPTFNFDNISSSTAQITKELLDNADYLPETTGDGYLDRFQTVHKHVKGAIESNDISILLTGHTYGINSIVVADKGYAAVDGVNVYAIPTKDLRIAAQGTSSLHLPYDPDWMK